VPSFHSCLISRVYALDIYLSLNTPSTSISDPTLHIKIPIQVSSEGNSHAQPPISAEEANITASSEVDQIFNPRSVAPPSPRALEQAQTDTPLSSGPAWTHRAQLPQLPVPSSLGYSVRMDGAMQRFQSLSFENEEASQAAMAPPPGYSAYAGTPNRVLSNVPHHLGEADANN